MKQRDVIIILSIVLTISIIFIVVQMFIKPIVINKIDNIKVNATMQGRNEGTINLLFDICDDGLITTRNNSVVSIQEVCRSLQ